MQICQPRNSMFCGETYYKNLSNSLKPNMEEWKLQNKGISVRSDNATGLVESIIKGICTFNNLILQKSLKELNIIFVKVKPTVNFFKKR